MKKHVSKKSALLCDELDPEDGQDPRRFFCRESSSRGLDHKALQLCKQVTHALELALYQSDAYGIPDDLIVLRSEPAPNASRLLVIFGPADGGMHDESSVVKSLNAAKGALRTMLAGEINRKRVPGLVFRYLPGGEDAL